MDPNKAEDKIKENTKPNIPLIAVAPIALAVAPAAPAAAPTALVATLASTRTAIPGLLS